jgi:iron complex outermembrane receptor protein
MPRARGPWTAARLACIAGLFASGPAAAPLGAQTADRDTLRVVEVEGIDVRVTRGTLAPERAPAAVSAVTGATIQGARATLGLDESLAGVPGVLINNRQNFSLGQRIAIRGFGTRTAFGVRGVRVLADGIPLTMPDGQTNLNNLDLASAGRIEVLRGPASALWGNAAGGVISVTTEAAPEATFAAQLRATTGDMGLGAGELGNLRKASVKAGGRSGPASFVASASRTDVAGFRAHSRGEVSQFNSVVRWTPDAASRVSLVLSAVDMPVAQNPGSVPLDTATSRPRAAWPANERTGSGETTRQVQAGLSGSRAVGDGRLDVAIHGLARSLENPLPFGVIDLGRRAGGVRAVYAGEHGLGAWPASVSVGADVEVQLDERREFNNDNGRPGTQLRRDQRDRVRAVGPFVQASVTPVPAIAATLGTRHDRVRFHTADKFLEDGRDDSGARTLAATSWFTGLAARPGEGAVTIYANVATSFQTPTTTELINAPPSPGETCCPGGFNANIQPQRALSLEVGVRGVVGGAVAIDVAAYTMDVRDAIVPFQIPQVDGRTFFRNAARTRHRGLEVGAGLARPGPWTLEAAWTWSRFIFIDDGTATNASAGNRFPGVPPHRVHLRAGRRVGVLRIEADLDRASRFFVDDANTASNQAATVLDLRLTIDRAVGPVGARPFAALQNATDTRYNGSVVVNAAAGRFYEPSPGRSLVLGLTLGTRGWTAPGR